MTVRLGVGLADAATVPVEYLFYIVFAHLFPSILPLIYM